MAISKVIYKESASATPQVWMDDTSNTNTAARVFSGDTGTLADGTHYTGTYVPPASVEVEALSVTENGTYTAPSGTAYSPVTVNVSGGGGSDSEDGIIARTISGSYTNSTVTKVGDYAFEYCSSLTAANFPECTTIGAYAFSACTSLVTISFPACTTIGSNAFLRCSRLTAANFPACTGIGTYVFQSCSSLATISFPACTSISGSAFRSCRTLLSAYFLGSSVPSLATSNVFFSTPIEGYTTSTGGVYGSIYVRASMLTAFQSATNWTYFSSRMVGLTDAQIAAL